METQAPQTLGSITKTFLSVIQDLSQYLNHQKALGNSDFVIPETAQNTLNKWGTASWHSHAFSSKGAVRAKIMIIDSEGSFFEGESGALLKKILGAMKIDPSNVYLTNAVDLVPIDKKLGAHPPLVIITLGQKAGQLLLGTDQKIEMFRGKFFTHKNIQVMPTFHPISLLDQPQLKRQVWEDMQLVMKQAGLAHGG